MTERTVTVDLGDGVTMAAVATQEGPELVAAEDVVATLGAVTGAIERVSLAALDAVRKARPDKATVELSFGLAIEEGKLIALFGKGKAEATITVSLEWAPEPAQNAAQTG